MSDRMVPIAFDKLLNQVISEYREQGTFFYVPVKKKAAWHSPLGPAAGPHTQLAQNIVAAYAAGAGQFELKTVQEIEGKDLGIIKPCIYVKGEAYNTEWSTELTVNQALEEYVKAWFLVQLLDLEFQLGNGAEVTFYMSVGYNLAGIQSEKMDAFMNAMKDASTTSIWKECIEITLEHLHLLKNVTKEDVYAINPHICNNVTLSTMHGCPPEEIEDIVLYLMKEKSFPVYLKLNPTLLGYDKIRTILDHLGYESIVFDKALFQQDLSFSRAVSLIKKLQSAAEQLKKQFGVKLTNTFPVTIVNHELEGSTMYMSGAPLYPISIGVAALLAKEFQGKLKISYSGGADVNNIEDILATGIYPVTMSTLLLKQGGYQNISTLNQRIEGYHPELNAMIDLEQLEALAEKAMQDTHYNKKKGQKSPERNDVYSTICGKCKNCIDVCPNRANYPIIHNETRMVLHKDSLCNECGNCSCFCILGHKPYLDKFTIFDLEEDFYNSQNQGVYQKDNTFIIRFEKEILTIDAERHAGLPKELQEILPALTAEGGKL